eukprot:gene14585-31047_t
MAAAVAVAALRPAGAGLGVRSPSRRFAGEVRDSGMGHNYGRSCNNPCTASRPEVRRRVMATFTAIPTDGGRAH